MHHKAERYIRRDQRRKWNQNRERLNMTPEDRERREWEQLHAMARGESQNETTMKGKSE